MQNVAGKKTTDADSQLSMELEGAGITVVRAPIPHPHPEVHTHVTGQLGEIVFRRQWYYWAVDCWIPYSVALELWNDPLGRQDVRVGGYAGNIDPLTYGTTWINAETGKHILPMREKVQCEGIVKESKDGMLLEIGKRILAENEFAEVPSEAAKLNGFLSGYHIDSYEGLKLFVATVKKYNCLAAKPAKD